MAETGQAKVRGNSKANVKRRGSTYTYYLYVTGPDGKRHQHSKGGFKTQREAEDARIAAEYTLSTGTYVKAERVSLADFLVDEWLPTRRPPVLEESTWHSYDRYIQLHVIPHIGRDPAPEAVTGRPQPALPTAARVRSLPAGAPTSPAPRGARACGCASLRRAHLRTDRSAAPGRVRGRGANLQGCRRCAHTASDR